jgi:glyoxylase-like metal-dependent hydrolase (beta-lactamase superfamily II)
MRPSGPPGLPGPTALPDDLLVFERGWLSSNNILLRPGACAPSDAAVLIDSGHSTHAGQTLALIDHALQGRPLGTLVNTHLHSDHCGGNAALQARHAPQTWVPASQLDVVQRWDLDVLSYAATAQRCDRFSAHAALWAGDGHTWAGQRWVSLAAPGHDPHALMLWREDAGVLIAGDALWENGFGVVFPELEGVDAFDDVAAVLDLIETLPVRWVIPGHGPAFTDVAGALQRARRRLAAHRTDPRRHARHGAKVLIKYHLMEERQQELQTLLTWAEATPLLRSCQARAEEPGSPRQFAERLLQELLEGGALRRQGQLILDA